jgi:hypothetical protein
MTARTDYSSSISTAESTKTNSIAAANAAHRATIDAALTTVGYRTETGDNVALRAAVTAANIAKLEALALAERVKQQAVAKAKDTLRDTGDRAAT